MDARALAARPGRSEEQSLRAKQEKRARLRQEMETRGPLQVTLTPPSSSLLPPLVSVTDIYQSITHCVHYCRLAVYTLCLLTASACESARACACVRACGCVRLGYKLYVLLDTCACGVVLVLKTLVHGVMPLPCWRCSMYRGMTHRSCSACMLL